MSNYQDLHYVWFDLKTGDGQVIAPDQNKQESWWANLAHYLTSWSPNETEAALIKVRRGGLPEFLLSTSGDYDARRYMAAGNYWFSLLTKSTAFWKGLLESGNKGRLVFEFTSEHAFKFRDVEYSVRGSGGGSYLVVATLDPDAPEPVRVEHVYDDPSFYAEIDARFQTDLKAWLEEMRTDGKSDDEDDEVDANQNADTAAIALDESNFDWSANDAFSNLYMHQRFPAGEVLAYIDKTDLKRSLDLKEIAEGKVELRCGTGDPLLSWVRPFMEAMRWLDPQPPSKGQIPLFGT